MNRQQSSRSYVPWQSCNWLFVHEAQRGDERVGSRHCPQGLRPDQPSSHGSSGYAVLRGEKASYGAQARELADCVRAAIAGAPAWARKRAPVMMTRWTSPYIEVTY